MSKQINTVPNQKIVRTVGSMKDKDNIYCKINIEALMIASRRLSSSTFKVWLYMAKNQADYTFALSKNAVCEAMGIKETSYHKSIKELIDLYYLV